jgi:hypothetical protein
LVFHTGVVGDGHNTSASLTLLQLVRRLNGSKADLHDFGDEKIFHMLLNVTGLSSLELLEILKADVILGIMF